MTSEDRSPGKRPVVETSAGGVVIRTIAGVVHVLVIRDPYKKWGLPKGHSEEGEDFEQTALREVGEETGLHDLVIGRELVTIDWCFTSGTDKIHKFTTFYLMYSQNGEPTPELGEGITACQWVPLERADERISYDNASEVVRVAQQILLGPASSEAAD